jgi:hypothetical protein
LRQIQEYGKFGAEYGKHPYLALEISESVSDLSSLVAL